MQYVDPCLLGKPKQGYRATMPIGVTCPLGCMHCMQQGTARYSGDLATNLSSLVKMGEAGVGKLYWDGAEPMTNPHIGIYMDVITGLRNNKDIPPYSFERVSLATSGVLATEQKARFLYDKGLKNIMVSIDGATEETHDSFRNKGVFKKGIGAIKIFNSIGYEVRLGTTIWSRNITELEDIARLGIDLGAKEVAYNWIQPLGNALKHPEIHVGNEFFQDISDRISEIKEKYRDTISINFHRAGKADPESRCQGSKEIVYVSGEWVWPCSWISFVGEDEFRSEMSLKENSLNDILENDPVLVRFRELVEELMQEGPNCPAAVKLYNGSFSGIDPIAEGGLHIKGQKSLK